MTPLLSYYGDDFTGSTDVMEALASHGVRTVLFTRQPSAEEFAPFTDYQAFGLAGTSRSQAPEWMDENLPRVFQWLKERNARFCHYKVCSTFDSSPVVGSIGRAIEIGARVFGQHVVPLVVGAPQLKRYTFAGNLFAAYQGAVYRIDRHPVMSRHPVTPMDEADLRLHLGRQTGLPIALTTDHPLEHGIILHDVHDSTTQVEVGRRLLSLQGPAFLAGSSGIEYALMAALSADGKQPTGVKFEAVPKADRIIAVSGSVSPTTERQIRYSLANGFDGIAADPLQLAGEDRDAVVAALIRETLARIGAGRSVLIYTALGHATNLGARLDAIPGGRQRVGEALGRILRDVVRDAGLKRAVVSGGDTSSHALGQLDIHALVTCFPMKATPGSPLCTAFSGTPALDRLEIAMKGGQVGGDDYFVALRDGLG